MKSNKQTGKYCEICGKEMTTWDIRCSKALGYKHPLDEECIAKEYEISVDELRDKLEDYFGMRPCMGL